MTKKQKQFEELMRKERFVQCAQLFGLDPKMLGKTYTDGGHTFKIIGLSPTGKRVLMEDTDTGLDTWSASVAYIKVKMAKDPEAAKKALQTENEKEYRKEYKSWAKLLKLPVNGIGKQFIDRGHLSTILGLTYNRKPYVIVESKGKRTWRYPVSLVLELLKSNPA